MEACNLESAMEAQQAAVPSSGDPRTVLTYLTFLEKKIGYLRGIITSAPRQIVSAELSCITVQLVAISKSLVATADEDAAKSKPPRAATAHERDSDSSDHDRHAEDDERVPPAGSYEVIQLEEEEILAPHVHSCKVCGKGFKRDANLRMHMRGHGEEYTTAAALAKPNTPSSPAPDATRTTTRCLYSCPYAGCKRNREHKSFQPLKTAVCVKNHYRRSHCDKSYVCRRCNVKRFSVLADLRTHEKHCGRDRWICSCGTSFSRKDKLFGHVAAFDGHAPALPPDDDDAANPCSAAHGGCSDQMLTDIEAIGRMASMECFSDASMFDDFSCSDMKGFPSTDGGRCLDDGRGFLLSPTGIDSCDFDGLDLFGAPGLEFGTPNLMGF